MAKHQSKGKGQRGSTWTVNPNQNLMLSCLIQPTDLTIRHSFNLSMMISLSIQRWLSNYVDDVRIKWPNDIYVGDKKICGILIENQLAGLRVRSAIIGIGININQTKFPEEIRDKVTSLKMLDSDNSSFNVGDCCLSLLQVIFQDYADCNLDDTGSLLTQYNEQLYQKDQLARYQVEEEIKEGKIKGVTADGQLIVRFANQEAAFDLKEIKFL